jgi:hypothetical protein
MEDTAMAPDSWALTLLEDIGAWLTATFGIVPVGLVAITLFAVARHIGRKDTMLRKALAILFGDYEYLLRRHPTLIAERDILEKLRGFGVYPNQVDPVLMAETVLEVVRESWTGWEVDRMRLNENAFVGARRIAQKLTSNQFPDYNPRG